MMTGAGSSVVVGGGLEVVEPLAPKGIGRSKPALRPGLDGGTTGIQPLAPKGSGGRSGPFVVGFGDGGTTGVGTGTLTATGTDGGRACCTTGRAMTLGELDAGAAGVGAAREPITPPGAPAARTNGGGGGGGGGGRDGAADTTARERLSSPLEIGATEAGAIAEGTTDGRDNTARATAVVNAGDPGTLIGGSAAISASRIVRKSARLTAWLVSAKERSLPARGLPSPRSP